MILKLSTAEILPKLSQVTAIVNSKNSIPILDNVLLEIKNNTMNITGSDTSVWVSMHCNVIEHYEPIRVCVGAHAINNALKNLESDEIVTMDFDTNKNIVVCNYSTGYFSLPYFSPNEFIMPNYDIEGAIRCDINSTTLAEAISKVSFCAGNDVLRPQLNSVRFDVDGTQLTCAATDANRLARFTLETINSNETNGFTLPIKPAQLLKSILFGTDGNVTLSFNDKFFTASNDLFKMVSRLPTGAYPKYQRIIPNDNKIIATIRKESLISALKRVIPMGNTNSELVKMYFQDNKVTITADDVDYNKSAKESVDSDLCGGDIVIGFKGSILIEALKNIDEDTVKIEMSDPNRACVIHGGMREKYMCLLMPIATM